MAVQDQDAQKIRRRDFLRAVGGGAVLLAVGDSLVGCGGGGGGSQIHTRSITASVNQSEIGGQGLTLLSVYSTPVSARTNGTLPMQIAASQAQMHMVVDAAGNPRALSVSNPSTGTSQQMTFDADSTAASLIFLSIGIVTSDPNAAALRLNAIRSLPSYSALVSLLRQVLPGQSLDQLTSNQQVQNALESCFQDYMASQKAISARPEQGRALGGITAAFVLPPPSNGTDTVNFTNPASRFVNIVQQNLDSNSQPLGQFTPIAFQGTLVGKLSGGLLDGQPLASIGTVAQQLIAWTLSIPGHDTATVQYQNPADTGVLRMWAVGPGNPLLSASGGPDLATYGQAALIWSVLYYVVLPLIDVFLGANVEDFIPKLGVQTVAYLYGAGQKSVNIALLVQAFQGDSVSQVAGQLIHTVIGVAGLVAPALMDNGVKSSVAKSVSGILTNVSRVFAKFNLDNVAESWLLYPAVSYFDLSLSQASVVLS